VHHLVEVTAGPDAELVVDRLWQAGALGVEELGDLIRAGFADPVAAASAATALGGHCQTVDDTTGLDGWRSHATVHRAGPFGIRPPWLAPADDPLDLVIDPGHAFGSGSHPSTRLALGLLADLVEPGTRVVDLGAGSGVLSVAAARLGATVVAVDNDPTAADAVHANAEANGVAAHIEFRSHDAADLTGTFAVGLCNMTIDLHERVGPAVAAATAIDRLVVAGLVAGPQEARALAAHRRSTVLDRRVEGEWVGLVLGPAAN